MLKVISAAILVGLMVVCGLVRANPVTYNLIPIQGMHSQLTGSITIDDADMNGHLVKSEVTGYSFISAGAISFAFSRTSSDNLICTGILGCFAVMNGGLYFDFSSQTPGGPVFDVETGDGSARVFLLPLGDLSSAWPKSNKCDTNQRVRGIIRGRRISIHGIEVIVRLL